MESSEKGMNPVDRISRPLASLLAVAVAGFRFLQHPPNFSPLGAMEVFCGARLRSWHAFALPLAIRIATDVLLLLFDGKLSATSFYASFPPFVYLSIVLSVLLGRLVRHTESPWKIAGVTLLASMQFYLITNFGVWVGTDMYPHTLSGLVICYVAALPFFVNSTVGYFGFGAVLFGAHAFFSRTAFPAERIRSSQTAPLPS